VLAVLGGMSQLSTLCMRGAMPQDHPDLPHLIRGLPSLHSVHVTQGARWRELEESREAVNAAAKAAREALAQQVAGVKVY